MRMILSFLCSTPLGERRASFSNNNLDNIAILYWMVPSYLLNSEASRSSTYTRLPETRSKLFTSLRSHVNSRRIHPRSPRFVPYLHAVPQVDATQASQLPDPLHGL